MSNFEEKETWYPSTESLAILRKTALIYLASGFGLAVLQFFGRIRFVGLAAGAILLAVGIGWLMANNPTNKKIGAIITGVGILLLLSRFGIYLLMVVAQTALNIVTIGLLVMGLKTLIRYFFAASKRS